MFAFHLQMSSNCISNLSGTFILFYNNSNGRSITEKATINIILYILLSFLTISQWFLQGTPTVLSFFYFCHVLWKLVNLLGFFRVKKIHFFNDKSCVSQGWGIRILQTLRWGMGKKGLLEMLLFVENLKISVFIRSSHTTIRSYFSQD